ncbi:MAG: anti-sigma factor [Actinobacteria bacterium]|nr:anti-sigma factor [Actinomycetota bacterium]
MRHDAERDAARFLAGDMTSSDRDQFSSHLLECAQCWAEVEQARRGRRLAEATRTAAPPALRDRVRGLVEADAVQGAPTRDRRRRWVLAGVPVAAAAVIALILTLGGSTNDPPSLRAAVADFTAQRLPGAQLPEQRAPDLSQLRLQPVGAGGGSYAGLDVDGYAYRDPAGRRVVLYLSDKPFPLAPGAERLAGRDGPWVARRGDVVVLCAREPHALLVVGQDDALVRSTAGALGVL